MTIKTSSGSTYRFTCKDGKLYFNKGFCEGIVTSLSGIQVGEHLTIRYYALNIYNQPSKDESIIRTTRIVSIT